MDQIPRQDKVQEWLNNTCFQSCPSPHYMCAYYDPILLLHKLTHTLKSCPVCSEEYETPSETLRCIESHYKHLCYFCLELMDIDKAPEHYSSRGHFYDKSKLIVPCPFESCDNQNPKFKFLDGLRNHILRVHLPSSNKSTESTATTSSCSSEGFVISEKDNFIFSKEDEDSGCVVEEVPPCSDKCDETDEEMEIDHNIIPTRVRVHNNGNVYPRVKTSVEVETVFLEVGLETESKAKSGSCRSSSGCQLFLDPSNRLSDSHSTSESDKHTFFVCQLCDSLFLTRIALNGHNMRRKCPGLENKRCFHCGFSFNGSSILNCVIHLSNCSTQTSDNTDNGDNS